jgi:hypothetical protein
LPHFRAELRLEGRAAADVRVSRHSIKLHGILADALFKQEPRRDIATVIEEAETAWGVLR